MNVIERNLDTPLPPEAAPLSRVSALRSATPCPRTASPTCPVPELGFSSYVISGRGEYILAVRRGSTAARIGLEPGDVILTLNGRRLTSERAWHQAMGHAAASHGRLTLEIRHRRTDTVDYRTCHLFSTGCAPIGVG